MAASTEVSASRSLRPMMAIGFAMFSDAFLYGVIIPLTSHSHVGVIPEGDLSLLYGGYAVGVLLFTPFVGFIADRIGKKGPLITGTLIQMLAILVFAFAPSFWILFLARVLQGGAAAATWTAGLAVVAENYKEDRVQKMGLSMVGYTAGGLAGPVLGGALYDLGGYYAPLALVGFVAMIDLVLRMTLLPRDKPHVPSHAMLLLLKNRAVIVSGVVVALIAGGWGIVEPHFPPYLEKAFNANTSIVGLIFTATGVAYGLVTVPVQRMTERRGLRDTIGFGLLLMAVMLPLMVITPNLILSAVFVCLVSVAFAFSLNPTLAELGDAVDRVAPGAYASVYVVFNIAYSLGMIGGDLITAPLVEHYSLLTGYLAISALLLGSLPLLWWSYRVPRVSIAATA
jgi:DHA1 family solute carrier family 18 vesicular amine transporter 1/2